MRRLAAVIVLLGGASVLAPVTNADAAMRPSGLRAAAAHTGLLMPEVAAAGHSQPLPGGFVLVQYNEGGGGGGGGGYSRPYNGGGGGYSRPSYGGGYSRQNHGGGNNAVNGAAAVIGIITILRQQQIMQQQQELLKRQQLQQYNDNLRRGQARREQELNNRRARNNERAKDNERKVNLEKAKREERLREEQEETRRELNDQNRVHNYPPATPQPVPAPVDPDPYHDHVGDIVVNIIPGPDNCPDNFQELRVGATVLYPRRTDFPANRSLCAGVTEKGCYLKVENTPATCGASKQVCVARCPGPLPTRQADIRPPYVVPTPIVPPTPVVIPTPTPTPVVIPPPAGCSGGNCAPQPVVNHPKPTKPAVRTVIAYNYVEPDRPKPTKPAVRTVIAYNYVEPDHPKPTKPAVRTVVAYNYVEPDHPKPTKPAVRTVIAYNYVEPDHPKPTKPAVRTVIAYNYVEPDRPKPTKPAVRTVIAYNYVEPDRPKPTKPAVRTVIAHNYVEHDHPKPIKPAVPTVKAHVEQKRTENARPAVKSHDDVETDHKTIATLTKKDSGKPQDSGEATHKRTPNGTNKQEGELDEVIFDPVKCPNLNFACADLLRAEEKKEEEAKKKRQEEEAFDRKVDSKNCTGNGGLSNASLRNNSNYRSLMLCITNNCKPMETSDVSFDHLPIAKVRDATTGVMAAIPKVGGALSGVIKLLWDDPTPDAVFNQMKAYVKKLVPQMILNERNRTLASLIDGMGTDLDGYRADTEPLSAGEDLTTIQGILRGARKEFDNLDHPEQMLTYFVAFGALHLAVMREQFLHTKEYYCRPGEDYINSQACADQHHAYLNKLNKGITDYTAAAQKLRDDVLAWRLSQIHVDTDHDTKVLSSEGGGGDGPPITNVEKIYKATAADDFCDTSLWHPATHEHAEFDDGPDDTKNAQADADARKAAVTKAFGKNLDLILAPLAHWASSTVEAAPVTAPGRHAAR